MKNCELCDVQIPDDYQNLLCSECYNKIEEENARLRAIDDDGKGITNPEQKSPAETNIERLNGISNPEYVENPEMPDKEQWRTNIAQFDRTGVLLYKPTRRMYTVIRDWCVEKVKEHPQYPKFIWKPKIVDVGCGCGVGSNVLSQEADFVWGIDKNEKSVRFAQEAFTRVKNNIYYSSQLTFDRIDITQEERELMRFDVVVAIEIIEHVADYRKFLTQIITKFDTRSVNEPTTYWISTPNRNNQSIQDNQPKNAYHVREWTSEEFYDVLSEYFTSIEFFADDGKPTERTTLHTPLLAKCSHPKI